ncbi:hypothetical protein AJ87_13540 [Rhizobium yanglingense]|nr:hypothetical protein AJ87_13540 [Rhizobium yanglingense]
MVAPLILFAAIIGCVRQGRRSSARTYRGALLRVEFSLALGAFLGSTTYFSPLKLIAPEGHSNSQAPHWVHWDAMILKAMF